MLAANQAVTVRAEGDAPDIVHVPLEGERLLTCLGIPHLYRVVGSRAGQAFAVRAEVYVSDPAMGPEGVSLEGKEFLPSLGVPDLHRVVKQMAGGQAFAVGAELRDATAFEGKEFLARLGIPDF